MTPLLVMLRLEEEVVAYTLGYLFDDKYHGYNTAFRAGYESGSPGKWVIHQTIREAFGRGLREFDFLRGGLELKAKWRPSARYNVRLVLFAGRPKTRLLKEAVFRVRPRIKKLISR